MLLLGSGSNIGQAVANKFEAVGYRVALAARSIEERHDSADRWSYKLDLNKPDSVEDPLCEGLKGRRDSDCLLFIMVEY